MKFHFTPLKLLAYALVLISIYNAFNLENSGLGIMMVLFIIPVLTLLYILSVIICKSKMSFVKIVGIELIITIAVALIIISATVNK